MDFLSGIPGWAWALIFIVGLVFVYGIFNRRWIEEERREAEAQKKMAAEAEVLKKTPAAEEPHVDRVRAAELRVKDAGEDEDDGNSS